MAQKNNSMPPAFSALRQTCRPMRLVRRTTTPPVRQTTGNRTMNPTKQRKKAISKACNSPDSSLIAESMIVFSRPATIMKEIALNELSTVSGWIRPDIERSFWQRTCMYKAFYHIGAMWIRNTTSWS